MNQLDVRDRMVLRTTRNLAIGFVLCCLGACSTVQQMREGFRPKPLHSLDSEEKAEVYSEIAAAQKKRSEAYVQIVSGDIELPLTSGKDKPSETRTYTIDVWFDDSVIDTGDARGVKDSSPLSDAIKKGEIVVEVLGAKASIQVARYGGEEAFKTSRSKINVEVDSRELTQSFTVIAKAVRHAGKWREEQETRLHQLRLFLEKAKINCAISGCQDFLDKHRSSISTHGSRASVFVGGGEEAIAAKEYILAGERYESAYGEQNPYMAVKVVRVFNGDLHTQIYMLSDEEARDAFGTNFTRYFYVGKAYFRNGHTDRKLIVHTTSLRARTVFYREPVNGDVNDSWWEKAMGSDGQGGRKSSGFARYDYILDASKDPSERKALTVAEEDVVLGIAKSKGVVERLLERRGSYPEARSHAGEVVKANLQDESNPDLVSKFTDFAVSATKQAIEDCELPDKTRSKVNDLADFYVQAFELMGSEKAAEDLVARQIRGGEESADLKAAKEIMQCIESSQHLAMMRRAKIAGNASPVALDLRKRVGLTDKIASASRDTYWQQRLSRHGYLWQDYYRPMTFEAVLLSLSAKTNSHPNNRILEYLQSIGVVAGSLVGLTEISSSFGTEGFAQRVALTAGVFVPELKKLIRRDLDQYLANLAATALPSIITLAPNESRDGYVFFPRGPIYGYGVDEFSLNEPSFIVNIDNEDVAVDGAMIEGELPFASGQKAMDMVQAARNQGRSAMDEDMKKLADLQARLHSYQLQSLSKTVCGLLADGKAPAAGRYLEVFVAGNKASAGSELVVELKARVKGSIACDKPLP